VVKGQPKYDVAISFLSADEPIASALYNGLSAGLDVFYYPHSQDVLAGTDGQESMRTPFLDDSRVVVVLYREPWGNTPWTAVEQTAIKDRCLKHGWEALFFIMLDDARPPLWLPHTHIRFNFANFSLDQAVGAIKARVQDSGGTIQPVSAVRRAEIFKHDQEYAQDRRQLRSAAGRTQVQKETAELFRIIERLCGEISATGAAAVQTETIQNECHLRNDKVSMVVTLIQTYSDSLSDTHSEFELMSRSFSKRLAFRGENLMYMNGKPRITAETAYVPDLDRARRFQWTDKNNPSRFMTSEELANILLIQFVELFEKAQRREFDGGGPSPFTVYPRRR
jgi:hypothetical protein